MGMSLAVGFVCMLLLDRFCSLYQQQPSSLEYSEVDSADHPVAPLPSARNSSSSIELKSRVDKGLISPDNRMTTPRTTIRHSSGWTRTSRKQLFHRRRRKVDSRHGDSDYLGSRAPAGELGGKGRCPWKTRDRYCWRKKPAAVFVPDISEIRQWSDRQREFLHLPIDVRANPSPNG